MSGTRPVRIAVARPVRVAVDIGGTFTDLQLLDARNGQVRAWKTPTTPADPSEGLLTGIREAAARFGFTLAEIGLLLHGTTIATNAVLERRLARGVLLTTAGFEDVLEIGRHVRRELYKLDPDPVPCLIPRDRRLGVRERLRADGSAETPLDVTDLLARLDALAPECVAVALLHAYAAPVHEQAIGALLARERPDLPVTLSSTMSPEMREYERASTTVLNAVLMPIVRAYLDRLAARLGEDGFAPNIYLVQSNGGVCSLATAAAEPARLLLSGPAGGALAAEALAAALQRPNLIAADMGGTSFDVSVVQDGRIGIVTQGEIDGLPVRLPMVEMRTIGAGGGSIASVAAGGRLAVGPRSAGARPGPVAYGRGGTEPTVTDANLALGRIDPAFFLGGAMALDLEATRAALANGIGLPLGLGVEAAAEGILTVANAALGAAIRLSLFEKGLDPRDFALLSFGGAGGLHATDVATELGIAEVVFPAEPGTLSAFGILHGDLRHDLSRSRLLPAAPASVPALEALLAALREEAVQRLDADAVAPAARGIAPAADLRYRGQAFELLVPWPDAPDLDALTARFHALHAQRFAYADSGAPVEIVTLRLTATGRMPRTAVAAAPSPAGDARKGTRRVFCGGARRDVAVWDRATLRDAVRGPALIEETFSTLWIGEGWTATPAAAGALVARWSA